MKRKSIKIATLVFAASISLWSTVFAASMNNIGDTGEKIQCNKGCHCKGHFFYESDAILKKLGLTEQDVVNGRETGKTIFDLTRTKNLTEKQVKAIIIEEMTTSINDKVIVGKISKEDAAKILEKKTSRVQNWDGNLKSVEKER